MHKKLFFLLSILLVFASAKSYGQADTILFEDMDGGVVPAGWDTHLISMETPASGGYARFEDDSSYMETPVLDLTGYKDVTLTFQVAKWGSGSDGPLTVEVSDDSGATWTVQTFDSPVPIDATYEQSGPDTLVAGGSNVKIKFSRPNSPSRKRLQDVFISGVPDTAATPSVPEYPISRITGIDPAGIPDSSGVYCWTKGVVLGVNTNPAGLQFTVWDTAGINAYSTSADWGYTVQEGDSVMMRGTVGQSNGLTRLELDTVISVNSNNPVPDPVTVNELNESTESHPVQLTDLEVVSVGQGSDYEVEVSNGDTLFTLMISSATNISGQINFNVGDSLCFVAGIGGQYDTAAPYFSGYYLAPRYVADIDTSCGTPDPDPEINTYPIGDVTSRDNDGIADSAGVYCAVEGIVYGVNLSSSGLNFTLIDETGGINVYTPTPVDNYEVEQGDEIKVTGEINQFNGQIRIQPDSIRIISVENCIPFPDLVDNLDDHTVSRFIEMRNVSIVDESNFPDIDIITLSGDSYVVRVDTNTEILDSIQSSPTGLFNIIGIGGQDDDVAPYTSDYYLTPMFAHHIDEEIDKPAPQDVYVNEVMPDNGSVIADDNGQLSSWIEIYNGSSSEIDLAGHYVTNDQNNEMMYRIPRCHENETTVPAGGFKLIWASNQESAGALYTGFELNNGGFTALYNTDGITAVDSVTYPETETDYSFGREDDGLNEWVFFSTSTPEASNANGEVFVSVEERIGNDEGEFKVYPNPAAGGILFFNKVSDVQLFDATGKLIASHNRVRQINVEALSSGLYLIKSDNEVKRVIVK